MFAKNSFRMLRRRASNIEHIRLNPADHPGYEPEHRIRTRRTMTLFGRGAYRRLIVPQMPQVKRFHNALKNFVKANGFYVTSQDPLHLVKLYNSVLAWFSSSKDLIYSTCQ